MLEVLRWSDRWLAIAAILMVLLFGLAQVASIASGYLWARPSFRYLEKKFDAINSPLCAGDDLRFEIGVWSNGNGKTTVLTGTFTSIDSPIPVNRNVAPRWVGAVVTGVREELWFEHRVPVPDDLPPGRYIYHQTAAQLPSAIEQSFSVDFEVIPCG